MSEGDPRGAERLFVALLPPPEVVDALAAAVAPARTGEPGLRWSDPARWHVTLAFLGLVDPLVRPALDARLERVSRRHGATELRLAGAGHFGQRVLWVRVAGKLGPLAAGVRRAAVRAGADGGDDRPLHAHLTLARVPDGHDVDLRALARALAGAVPPLAWAARTMTLMSSVGGPAPVYRIEAGWDLRGSVAAR